MHRSLLLLPLLSACAPQNASIEIGDFTAYLSDSGSISLKKGELDLTGFARRTAVDCREFETARNQAQNEELRLGDGPGDGPDNRLPVCDGDDGVASTDWPPEHESWLNMDGFHVVGDVLDPWRGEAILTSEGDVQIGFHNRLPGGADFRFAFVIDPNFQPRTCVQNESGDGVELVDVDGKWVDEWSKDAGDAGGTMFYLNASSYQFSPASVEDYDASDPNSELDLWFLPNEWMAGYAEGQFGDDRFRLRTARFASPSAYLSYETSTASAGDVAQIGPDDLFFDGFCGDDCAADAREVAGEVNRELVSVGLPGSDEEGEAGGGLPTFKPRVHDNKWRPRDDNDAGLDGWAELHYNWVRFDAGSSFEKGGEASGEFVLAFDANESSSRFFVRGKFTVDRWKKDQWTTKYLPTIKLEENGTELCGVSPEQAAELL